MSNITEADFTRIMKSVIEDVVIPDIQYKVTQEVSTQLNRYFQDRLESEAWFQVTKTVGDLIRDRLLVRVEVTS